MAPQETPDKTLLRLTTALNCVLDGDWGGVWSTEVVAREGGDTGFWNSSETTNSVAPWRGVTEIQKGALNITRNPKLNLRYEQLRKPLQVLAR